MKVSTPDGRRSRRLAWRTALILFGLLLAFSSVAAAKAAADIPALPSGSFTCALLTIGLIGLLATAIILVREVVARVSARREKATAAPHAPSTAATSLETAPAVEAPTSFDEHYRTLVENLPVGMGRVFCGPPARWSMANPSMAHLLGFDSPDELVETRPADRCPDRRARLVFSRTLKAQGRIIGETLTLEKKNGTPFQAFVTAQVLRDARGRIFGFDALVEDVAAEAAVQEHGPADITEHARPAEPVTVDPLTGLCNHRRFNEILGRELERARRQNAPVSLAIFDVESPEATAAKDTKDLSDRLLVQTAEMLRTAARAVDIVARYAGDELVVLMPDTSAAQAAAAAERLRRLISAPESQESAAIAPARTSVGVGSVGAGGTLKADRLVRLADDALCEAKRAGANCTRAWDEIQRDRAALEASREADDLLARVAGLSDQARDIFFQRIHNLAQAYEDHDPWSHHHSDHVLCYALGIAHVLGLDPAEIDTLRRAAMVHDVGKIGVPESIFGKTKPLSPDERRLVEQHSLIGVQILDQARCLGHEVSIVRHHHERWDGNGYPDGIYGRSIPRGARILAVADTFDAITSKRAYRPPRTIGEAVRILREESGRQFDPDMVDAMLTWVENVGRRTGKSGRLATDDLLGDPSVADAAKI